MQPSPQQPRRDNWADEDSDQDDEDQQEDDEQNSENNDRTDSGEKESLSNSNNDQVFTSDFRQSLKDLNQNSDIKERE